MSLTASRHPDPFWYRVLCGRMPGGSQEDKGHLLVVTTYVLLAFLSMFVFGLLNLAERNTLVAQLELAGSAALFLNLVGLRLTRNANQARNCLMITVIVMLLVMIMTGGTQGAGIFWFFLFPIMAFFLGGRKQGIWWTVALYAVMAVVVLLAQLSIIQLHYSFVTIRQLLICLGVATIGIYVYQGARETAMLETISINRTKSEFVTLASHQLRTPISAVSWLAEMLLSGDAGKLTKEQRKDIEEIYYSNQRMTAIINDMLMVSKLDLGSLSVKPVQTNVASVTRQALKDVKKTVLEGRQLTIVEQFAPDTPHLSLDPDLMRVIMRNLLSNAIKYTPDNGKITIRIAPTRTLLPHGENAAVQIDVEDTGYGIPAAAQEKLFTRFFRGRNIQEKDTDGTGLGLFLVKNLLDYAGGDLRFTSEENVGSTFTVLLPENGMRAHEEG